MIKWPSLALFFRNRNKPVIAAKPARLIQGYVDEITATSIIGWARNGLNPHECILVEFVLPGAGGERIIGRCWADKFYLPLSTSGFGDGKYGFDFTFQTPLTPEERRHVIARAQGSTTPLQRAHEVQGFVDQRSTHHVAGWARNRFDALERVQLEAVLPTPEGEKILATGTADRFYRGLAEQVGGDGLYGFFMLLREPVDEAARDQLIVRPVNATIPLELAPNIVSHFNLFSYAAMDIVNNCNLRCPFCLFDYADTKSTRFMSEEVFDSALRLAPLVRDGGFWLSCLHEPSMHPKFLDFIARVPKHLRRKLMFTTNLAKRMPASYFEALAASGVFHINISIESLDPPIYEKFRKGARWPIFKENWDRLITAWRAAANPPNLRYVTMAYQSNCREIPALVKYLIEERLAWQVEVRYTFDLEHIAENFRESEYLGAADWRWLQEQLGHYPSSQLILTPPSESSEPDPVALPTPDILPETERQELPEAVLRVIASGARFPALPLNAQIKWDGSMVIHDKWEHALEATHRMASGQIQELADPVAFLEKIAATPSPDSIYGFIDEITPFSVTGWVRNYSNPAKTVEFDVVLVLSTGEKIIAHGRADQFCQSLQDAGYSDPAHGLTLAFAEPLSVEERDSLEIRPLGAPIPLRRAPKYQGYVDQRSTHHVQGWIRNRFDPEERVEYEVVDISQKFERVLGRGIADLLDPELAAQNIGDARYGFRFLFAPPLSEEVRDAIIVRPVSRPLPLALSPRLVTEFAAA